MEQNVAFNWHRTTHQYFSGRLTKFDRTIDKVILSVGLLSVSVSH